MRLKRFEVSPELLLQLCTVGNKSSTECIRGVPVGARVARIAPSSTGMFFLITVEHESFDHVQEGAEPPWLECPQMITIPIPGVAFGV